MRVEDRLVGTTAGTSTAVDRNYQKSGASAKMKEVFSLGGQENALPPKYVRPLKKEDDFTRPTNASNEHLAALYFVGENNNVLQNSKAANYNRNSSNVFDSQEMSEVKGKR